MARWLHSLCRENEDEANSKGKRENWKRIEGGRKGGREREGKGDRGI